jgi:hypothetical protein
MKYLINDLHSLPQRGSIPAISMSYFHREVPQPLQIAFFSKETADLHSFLKKAFYQMASDESCSPCY